MSQDHLQYYVLQQHISGSVSCWTVGATAMHVDQQQGYEPWVCWLVSLGFYPGLQEIRRPSWSDETVFLDPL